MSYELYELFNGRHMCTDKFGHTESTNFVRTENLGHLFVGDEILLVVRSLEIVFLEIGPKKFDTFGTAGLHLANDISQISAELQRFGESVNFWSHFDNFLIFISG